MKPSPEITTRWTCIGLALLGLLGAACSGKNLVIVDTELAPAGASGVVASAGAMPWGTGGGTSSGSGGASATLGAAGTSASGAAGSTPAGGGGAAACTSDADCTSPAPCVAATCKAGVCRNVNLVRGTGWVPDVPANCHAQQCNGLGDTEPVLDLGNAPAAATPCVVGTCDDSGKPTTTPSPAGQACASPHGGILCDGAGECVQCLTNTDCNAGVCVDHGCASSTCSDGEQDGTETDIDCGGTCPACVGKKACKIDQDCASDDCDALELVCLPASCIDQKLDGSETDVDCGGPDCAGCYWQLKCQVDSDCATQKCDPVTRSCTGNPCADHRQDGTESDIDCGGYDLVCAGCKAGQKCQSSFDCFLGLACDQQVTPHECVPL